MKNQFWCQFTMCTSLNILSVHSLIHFIMLFFKNEWIDLLTKNLFYKIIYVSLLWTSCNVIITSTAPNFEFSHLTDFSISSAIVFFFICWITCLILFSSLVENLRGPLYTEVHIFRYINEISYLAKFIILLCTYK